jgi:hypothetical protein
MEGHSRATAYAITARTDNVDAFVARAPSFAGWRHY